MSENNYSNQPYMQATNLIGRAIRDRDWASYSMGPPQAWPAPLQVSLNLIHYSPRPAFIVWGPEFLVFYNEACVELFDNGQIRSYGRPLAEVDPTLASVIAPFIERVFQGQVIAVQDVNWSSEGARGEKVTVKLSFLPVHDLSTGNPVGAQCTIGTPQWIGDVRRDAAEEIFRYKNLFEMTQAFVAILTGPSQVFQLANESAKNFLGKRDLVGRTAAEVLPDLSSQGIHRVLSYVYKTGVSYVGKRKPVRFGDGSRDYRERIVDVTCEPFLDNEGNVIGVFITGSDVTDAAATEQRLTESSLEAIEAAAMVEENGSRLRALLDAVPAGIAYLDNDGIITSTNSAFRQFWEEGAAHHSIGGKSESEWVGWWADGSSLHGQRVAPSEWPGIRALKGEVCHGDIVEVESQCEPHQRKYVFVRAAPMRDLYGSVTGAVLAEMDITAQVQAEIALRESEAKFRTIANAMPQMVWSTRPDGYHDYYNQGWYDFTGLPVGSTDGDGWNAVFHADDQARAWETWKTCLETGEAYEIEYRLRHHSGEYRWTLGRALPVRGDGGEIVRWMGTCTDIHEQKLTQEKLKDTERRKDEFLAMLAHELRNPLAPISSAATILSSRASEPASVGRLSAIIARQAQHMSALINDLMDISRVTRGLICLDREPVVLAAIVSDAIEQTQPLMEARKHTFETSISQSGPVVVMGDKQRLVQVVANLLNNAAKYTRNGGHIRLDEVLREKFVEISVTDNGQGVAGDLLKHVFDLFSQGKHDSDRTQGGLGIGLSLVKSLVTLHGGTVSAYSAGEGQGSKFSFTLPLLTAQSAEDSPLARH